MKLVLNFKPPSQPGNKLLNPFKPKLGLFKTSVPTTKRTQHFSITKKREVGQSSSRP
jgi:hypothetical protein